MSQNPREAWERMQMMLQKQRPKFGGMPPGAGGGMGMVGGAILLGLGTWAVSNSLYNGM